MKVSLYNDDCLNVLKDLDSHSIDSCVTDPPYGLSFMGKSWDYDVPKKEIWEQVFRVLKPGGHLLAFFGSRTYHRGVIQIEDAGFEIRDQIMWLYGSGFPKSHDISKAIDKEAGVIRTPIGSITKTQSFGHKNNNTYGGDIDRGGVQNITEPATDEAKQWDGWGTALKPAHEPIVVARKPITQTVAKNVLEHGTGALNIDGCRVGNEVLSEQKAGQAKIGTFERKYMITPERIGRWPANVIHDGSDEVVSIFPDTGKSGVAVQRNGGGQKIGGDSSEIYGGSNGLIREDVGYSDNGSAARFFYCAKASKSDRDEGNNHPTVKPTELMRYLCRLVTPKGGVVLDPFMGSGSTGKAALLENFGFIGIESDQKYFDIAKDRIKRSE